MLDEQNFIEITNIKTLTLPSFRKNCHYWIFKDVSIYFDAPDHMAIHCPRQLNPARAASKKLEYLNKKKANHAVPTVLADMCFQFQDNGDGRQCNLDIFLNLLSEEKTTDEITVQDGDSKGGEDALVMEITIDMMTSMDGIFQGACIDSGAQLTVIGLGQAKACCRLIGGGIVKSLKPLTFRFGDKRHKGIGKFKIRVPVNVLHILDVIADVVDTQVPFLFDLEALTKIKAMLDVGNNVMMSPTVGWELSLS